jgi:hypothetical protein
VLRERQRLQGGDGELKPEVVGSLAVAATAIAAVTSGLARACAVVAAALLLFWAVGLLIWRR